MLKFPGGKIFIFSGTSRGKESGIRGADIRDFSNSENKLYYNNVLAIWEQVGYNRRDNYKMRELVSKGEIMKKRRRRTCAAFSCSSYCCTWRMPGWQGWESRFFRYHKFSGINGINPDRGTCYGRFHHGRNSSGH